MKTTLIQAAWIIVQREDRFWAKKFKKLRYRQGAKRAIIVIARKILVAIYWMLKNKTPFQDLGADYVDKKAHERKRRYLQKQLENLGFNVDLTKKTVIQEGI